jgi:hypothetical protein
MALPPPGASFNFKTVPAFTRRFSTTESLTMRRSTPTDPGLVPVRRGRFQKVELLLALVGGGGIRDDLELTLEDDEQRGLMSARAHHRERVAVQGT